MGRRYTAIVQQHGLGVSLTLPEVDAFNASFQIPEIHEEQFFKNLTVIIVLKSNWRFKL